METIRSKINHHLTELSELIQELSENNKYRPMTIVMYQN